MKVLLPIALLVLLSGIAWMALSGEGDSPGGTLGGAPEPRAETSQDATTPRANLAAAPDRDTGPGLSAEEAAAVNTERRAAADRVIREATANGELAVYVLDKTGTAPIAEADVWLLHRDSSVQLEWQQSTMTQPKRKRLVQDRGQHAVSDENGVAVFPNVLNGVVLVRHDGSFAWKEWVGPVSNPLQVRLTPEVELLVEVLDPSGQPVPQVPVAIGVNYPDNLHTLVKQNTSAPSGVASFRGVTPKLRSQRTSLGFAVGFAFPTSQHQVVAIDPENLPDEPVQLTLPPASRLIVKVVDEFGEPIQDRFTMAMGTLEYRRDHEGATQEHFRQIDSRRVNSGQTRFDFVEEGVPVTFKLSGLTDRRDMTFTEVGPSASVEQNELVLAWNDVYPKAYARAFAPGGLVMAETSGRVHIEVDGKKTESATIRTDEEGHFSFAVRNPWDPSTRRTASMVMFVEGQQYDGEVDLSFDPNPKGSNLGKVIFRERPVIASGEVFGVDGPVRGAMVRAEQLSSTGDWYGVSDAMAVTTEAGQFLLRGSVDSGALRITATAPGYKTARLEGVGMGTANIVLQLEQGMDEPSADKRAMMKGSEEWTAARKLEARGMTPEQMEAEAQRREGQQREAQQARREEVEAQKRRDYESRGSKGGRR